MRKGILGLLAYCLTGLQMAQAQSGPGGGYQEPLPVQSPGARYGMPYAAPAFSRFPSFQAPSYPTYVPNQSMPQPRPLAGMPTGYAVPMDAQSSTIIISEAGPGEQTGEKLAPPVGGRRSEVRGPISDFRLPTSEHDGGEDGLLLEGPLPEPAEPYMVGPIGTWKPSKGYCFYGSAEYLFWWERAQPLPSHLSLSLSSPNTVPELRAQGTSGGRFFLGVWLSDRQDLGLEAGYFFLGSRTNSNSQNFPGSAIANKPIFDGIVSESSLLSSSTSLWGSEANLRYQWWRSSDGQGDSGERPAPTAYLDLLGGFRYVDLSENLTINSSTLFGTAPVLLSNALLTTSDSFGTHNHFFAGQIGADAGVRWGRWSLNLYTKLAMGDNHETVVINGNTRVSAPPVLGNFAVPGGFFAQPSNIGRFNHEQFAVLPEVGVKLGFKLGDHCRVGVGYNFLYLSSVVRPGEQIDVTAGGSTRPPLFFLGGTRPQPAFLGFNESGFWAQGLSAMLEVSY